MPSGSRAVIAAAGSGKTQMLVDEALSNPSKRILITTYTRENLREIEARLWKDGATIEHSVDAMSWYEFLLRDCVKPYQACKTDIGRIRSVNFSVRRQQEPSLKFVRKTDFDRYYFDTADNVYQDVVADLACLLDDVSGGKVVARLASCYEAILIDEMQDLAGYDLVILERLLHHGLRLVVVGDPRQALYSTNSGARYRQYRRAAVIDWIAKQEGAGLLDVQALDTSYRCNQPICDYADALYPDLPRTTSANASVVDDMGVHLVHVDDVDTYIATYSPQELRWNKAVACVTKNPLNFGQVKGTGFDRVLIRPTRPMTAYVETGADLADEARAKFYVAATRARHSAGIITSRRTTQSGLSYWIPPTA